MKGARRRAGTCRGKDTDLTVSDVGVEDRVEEEKGREERLDAWDGEVGHVGKAERKWESVKYSRVECPWAGQRCSVDSRSLDVLANNLSKVDVREPARPWVLS